MCTPICITQTAYLSLSSLYTFPIGAFFEEHMNI